MLAPLALALVAACGGSSKSRPSASTTTTAISSHCPDLTKPDELAAFDFVKEYQLSRDAADKLKAAALAALEIDRLAEKLDAELGIACAQIASDLGTRGDWRGGSDACAAAIKAVQEARAKLGSKASTELVVRAPVCVVDASLMTKCASLCDSSVPAERVRAECQRRAGRCDGNCDGTCETSAPVKCGGTCAGSCDGPMRGACGGRCRGTCDGQKSSGPCAGVCAGLCEKGTISGECKGACTGTCTLAAPGICSGICVGSCSVELTDSRCAGEFKTPDVSTDCRARCDLAVINQTECSSPQVGLVVTGVRERDKAEHVKASVDKALGGLLKILFEIGDKGRARVLNARAVIESARSGFRDMSRSAGSGAAAASEKQITKCFDAAFKNAAAAAGTIQNEIDQATAVRDELGGRSVAH